MIHVFPFAKRDNTKSATMSNQIDGITKKQRVKVVSELATQLNEHHHQSYVGKTLSVIIENKVGDFRYQGHSSEYLKVMVTSKQDLYNKAISVMITGVKDGALIGVIND